MGFRINRKEAGARILKVDDPTTQIQNRKISDPTSMVRLPGPI